MNCIASHNKMCQGVIQSSLYAGTRLVLGSYFSRVPLYFISTQRPAVLMMSSGTDSFSSHMTHDTMRAADLCIAERADDLLLNGTFFHLKQFIAH